MTESGFEARLARAVREMAESGIRPFDPRAMAEAVVATRRGPFGLGHWPATREGRRWFAFAAAALLLAGLLGLALAFLGSRPAETGRLAFARNGELWVANLDGTGARLLVAHDRQDQTLGSCTGFQWSPDGSRLAAAFHVNDGDPRHLRISVLSADGVSLGSFDVELGLAAVEGPGIAFAWSPDGNHLAVLAPQASVGGLWLIDGQGRLERDLALPQAYRAANPIYPMSISWSPDGRLLAVTGCPCTSENHGGWILPMDGSDSRSIQPPGGGNVLSLAWNPDGTRLAFGSANWNGPTQDPDTPGELWVVGANGGSSERIATRVELIEATGWSRDGKWIAFSEPGAIDVVRADGSGTPVTVGANTNTAPTRWSKDQRLFYLDVPRQQSAATPSELQTIASIKVLDPAGGDPTVVLDGVDAYPAFDLH